LLRNHEAARRIGESARARVSERFTIERLVADTEGLYAGLLAKRGIVTPWTLSNLATRS
jgi:glycosyltransferase involved in cell wall biosynthesis